MKDNVFNLRSTDLEPINKVVIFKVTDSQLKVINNYCKENKAKKSRVIREALAGFFANN